jgi:hypothetical protein
MRPWNTYHGRCKRPKQEREQQRRDVVIIINVVRDSLFPLKTPKRLFLVS